MRSRAYRGALLSVLFVFSAAAVVWAVLDQSYNRPDPLMDYVAQEDGRYDSGYWTLQEEDCRACHGNSLADRHHYTEWALQGQCLHCHANYPDVVPVERDCTTSGCHSWPDDIGAPPDGNGWHHNTDHSAAGNCYICHDPSIVGALQPGISFDEDPPGDINNVPTVFNCENCHWEQAISNQNGDPDNPGNPSTYHHYDIWGTFVGFYEYPRPVLSHLETLHMGGAGNVSPQCYMCHSLTGTSWDPDPGCDWDPFNLEQIRFCQRCHTMEMLHLSHAPDFNGWEAVGFHVPGKPEADPDTYRLFSVDEVCFGCHGPTRVVISDIALKDLDNNVTTEDFTPGANIRYKVKFTVASVQYEEYKVVVTGKAFSLYEPDGVTPEWKDTFDNPTKKRRKFFPGEDKQARWDRQIPTNATPGTQGKVKFTLKLKQYDEVSQTWNLVETFYAKKEFNIIQE